jgi:hypothetical protein
MFHDWLWVLDDEKLHTTMIQEVHDSKLSGHLGREGIA